MSEATTTITAQRAEALQTAREDDSKAIFGFWTYLMTDCILFASLFATYAVLHGNTFGGPSGQKLFDLPYILAETLVLLTSSFTCGLAILALQKRRKEWVLALFAITFILGVTFLVLETTDFAHLVATGNSWRRSGFLSSYFTLVSTHGLHITIGLIWMAVMMIKVKAHGLTRFSIRRLKMLSLFWHFLDVVWIFIFTVVYLFGGIGI